VLSGRQSHGMTWRSGDSLGGAGQSVAHREAQHEQILEACWDEVESPLTPIFSRDRSQFHGSILRSEEHPDVIDTNVLQR
jgi:hypothetical protein